MEQPLVGRHPDISSHARVYDDAERRGGGAQGSRSLGEGLASVLGDVEAASRCAVEDGVRLLIRGDGRVRWEGGDGSEGVLVLGNLDAIGTGAP